MAESALDDAAFEIYSVDPTEFVAARKSAAESAKQSGDRKLATAIGKLRKPTTVGWMVNLLVRAEPEEIAELFALGDGLRDAQRRSDAEKLRSLSARRQQAIRELSLRAAELAAEHGRSRTEDAVREVAQTLGAALADPEIAERVRAGRVTTAESYSGFGPAGLAVAPEPEATDSDESEDDTNGGEAPDESSSEALAEALAELEEAREDENAAVAAAESAQSDAESAAAQLAEVKDRLTRLRAELHELETQEAEARRAEKATARESRRLARVLGDAQARTAQLQRTVDELRG